MKICVIADTHAGWMNDNSNYYEIMRRFYAEDFFPVIDEYNIKTVIHIGDILERRRYVNFVTLNRVRKDFLEPLFERGCELILTAGNHDVYHKDTNEICGPNEIWGDTKFPFEIYTDPVLKTFDGCDIAMIPWITVENRKRTMAFLKKTKAQIVFGHLELVGHEMSRVVVADHGDDPNLFQKFDIVASGHYHHKSQKNNIHYLGSPFQFDWGDAGDLRGFHIFDTETREFEFWGNTFEPFIKFQYDDEAKTLEQMMDFPVDHFRNKFVKVIVTKKTNPYVYDLVVDHIEKAGVLDMRVVDDHLNMDNLEDSEILESEDTLTMLRNYANAIPIGVDKSLLDKELESIYKDALMAE